ncbi:MAG: hypothetical protein GWN66_20105, partial [Pseudomonas stutzeri]|nr:hypothetical protein [Stutzerimonas stutzeri]
ESIYGIWDPTPRDKSSDGRSLEPVQASELLEQAVESLVTTSGQNNFFGTTRRVIDWTRHRGWRLQLG